MKTTIHNVETGEIIEREMNAEELAQYQKDQVEAQALIQAQIEAIAKRTSALGKLQALGLDEDDLKALGL